MTFTYANVIPQNQYNNGGIWNTFERYSRDLAMNGKCDSVEVISGPIYFKGNEYQGENGEKFEKVYQEKSVVLMEDGMMVPEKLYKIVKCNKKVGEQYLDAFEFWNKKTFDNDKPLKHFLTSIKSV
jgi:DNA/RNA endonuclease G (NUC1)